MGKENDFNQNQIANQKADVKFLKELLEEMFLRDERDRISNNQRLWRDYRLCNASMTIGSVNITLNLFSLFQTGEIESATRVIFNMVPDDMSENYHWLNWDKLAWLNRQIQKHLGQTDKDPLKAKKVP